MSRVTRTLKKGGDAGRLNRDDVRAVTIALREGRRDDVISGRVLQEARAARAIAERAKKNTGQATAAA